MDIGPFNDLFIIQQFHCKGRTITNLKNLILIPSKKTPKNSILVFNIFIPKSFTENVMIVITEHDFKKVRFFTHLSQIRIIVRNPNAFPDDINRSGTNYQHQMLNKFHFSLIVKKNPVG